MVSGKLFIPMPKKEIVSYLVSYIKKSIKKCTKDLNESLIWNCIKVKSLTTAKKNINSVKRQLLEKIITFGENNFKPYF
jgi:hypothetical protein